MPYTPNPSGDYELGISRQYLNGGESERLRLERLHPDIVGLYEHRKCWNAWDSSKARELRNTARSILFDPRHVLNHHGDWSKLARENCATCVLNGKRIPNYAGWERTYVQAGAAIPEDWREAFADVLNERTPYAEALGRDIATFGLMDGRGLVTD